VKIKVDENFPSRLDALVARVPEWAEMIRRESERQSAP